MIKKCLSILLSVVLCIICFENITVSAETYDDIEINVGSTSVTVTNQSIAIQQINNTNRKI
jgi:hypothetical protein